MANRWTDHNSYLQDKNIPQLLEALTAGLIQNRPQDHHEFLLASLDRAKQIGTENVRWDTFVTSPPEVRSGNGRSDRAPEASGNGDVDEPGPHLAVVEASQEATTEAGASENDLFNIDAGVLFMGEDDEGNEQHDKNSKSKGRVRDSVPQTDKTDDKITTLLHLRVHTDHLTTAGGESAKENTGEDGNTGLRRKFSWQRREFVNMAATTQDPQGGGADHPDNPDAQWKHTVAEMSEQTLAPNITDQSILEVIKGSFNNTPVLPTNTVRIFLSSTFSDFRAERNILPKKAYPVIQEFCRERGLEFQVLDMRWGVTDEMMNDHQVTSLCIREIHSCQQVSCGPSFVALVGNRYGYRPFPSSIDAKEFESLVKAADRVDQRGSDTIREWFQRNGNVAPPVYELQPIASKFIHYNDKGAKDLYKKDRKEWQQIFEILHSTLKTACEKAYKAGLLQLKDTVKYNISVTEDEIQNGLINARDAKTKALCFQRRLHHLDRYLQQQNTGRFVELRKNQDGETLLDDTSQVLLEDLITKKIPEALEGQIQRKYEIEWKGVNLEMSEDKDHQQYLEQFCNDFITDMKNLIELNHKKNQVSVEQEYKHLLYEVVHHTKFAKSKLELFCGREEEIEKIKALVQTPSEENEPVIIHAPSGYGKTSLLAKCASMMPKWFQADTVTVLRFLGTSAESSNIRSTLLSVMSQLYAVLNYTMPADDKLEKMGDVRRYFWNVITILGEKHTKIQFVLVLDSVDQLAESNGALKLTWLPRSLPPNVNIVLSFVTDMYSCLDYAQQKIKSPSHFLELPALSSDVGEDIMKTFQNVHNCRLTEEQHQIVLNAFQLCSQPLYLKLLLDESIQWTSYTDKSSLNIPKTVHDAIFKMFEDLEVKYGEVFVSHALSYLTSGLGGLTDIEMDDVLSCDDDVLNEVYQYHDPPLEGTIRVPALMWARLGFELKYLSERQVDEKTVKTWHHRQFWQAAEKRYLSDPSWKEKVHTNLSELFHQHKGIQRTIVLTQRQGKVIENADRLVTAQPLVVSNRRKLNALPYHLFHGKQFGLLKEDCLINFDFIFAKLQAVGIGEVFSEYEEYTRSPDLQNDTVLRTMKNFIEISFDALHFDPVLLPFTLKERLTEFKEDNALLLKLVNASESWLTATTKPLLLPTNPISITKLNSPIRFSAQLGCDGVMNTDEDIVVATWKHNFTLSAKIMAFDLNNRDLLANITLGKESPICISPDNKHVVFFLNSMVKVCEITTGDCVREITYLDEKYDNVTGRTIKFSSDGRYLILVVKLGRPLSVPESGAWRIMSGIFNVDMREDDADHTNMIKFPTKKHVDRIELVKEDTRLVALAKDKFLVFTFPKLEKVYECRENIKLLHGIIAKIYPESNTFIAPQALDKGCRYLKINYETNEVEKSDVVHIKGKGSEGCYPFGFHGSNDMSKLIMGTTASKNDVRETMLWVWQDGSTAKIIHIGNGEWKQGSCLAVTKDCNNCIVGWKNGDVSVVSLIKGQEMCCIHGHAQDISCILFRDNERYLLTFASDHLMKIWDTQMLFEEAERQGGVKRFAKKDNIEIKDVEKHILDDSEQVVSLTATDDFVVTAPHINADGPKLWDVNDGAWAELTESHDKVYKASLEDSGNGKIMKSQRYHADISICDPYLTYIRKQRDHCFVYLTKVTDPKALAHRCFKDCFFSFTPSPAIFRTSNTDPYMMLVEDGFVTKVSIPHLEQLEQVEIPKISVEFGNMHSSNTKRKLTYFKQAISIDGKYFVVCNPAPGVKKGTQKYFDLIDLEKKSNSGRIKMPDYTPWKILDDSFYYLLFFKTADPQIHKPSTLSAAPEEPTYRCALCDGRGANKVLSDDFTLGLEITKNNSIRMWDVETAVRKQTLRGHASQITCTDISVDKRHLVSGSYDNTVRLWSLETAQQLCLFCTYGTIDGLMFTPSTKYIIANYYSAPQRKRAVILRLHNVK